MVIFHERLICLVVNNDRYGALGQIEPISMHGVVEVENFIPAETMWSLIKYVGQCGP